MSTLRGGSRIFFRRGCTRLLLYFNTNKPHSFFCRITVVLENRRSSPPRSAADTETFCKHHRFTFDSVDSQSLSTSNHVWIRIPIIFRSGSKLALTFCIVEVLVDQNKNVIYFNIIAVFSFHCRSRKCTRFSG